MSHVPSTMPSSRWIDFVGPVRSPSGKTLVFSVCTKEDGAAKALGEIAWYGPWRKYAFSPRPNTVFEATCLRDLAAFCDWLMTGRGQARSAGDR